jgi:hypothetical protein
MPSVRILEELDPVEIAERVLLNKGDWIAKNMVTKEEAATRKTIALLGPSGSGKDFGAIWLTNHFACGYDRALSMILCRFLADELDLDIDEIVSQRHTYRMFLYSFANALRAKEPAMLVRLATKPTEYSHLVVGIRARPELMAALQDGYVSCAIWVDNPTVGEDPTIEYGPDACHLVIKNDPRQGSAPYFRRLAALAKIVGWQQTKPFSLED